MKLDAVPESLYPAYAVLSLIHVCPTDTFAYLIRQLSCTYHALFNSHAGKVQADSAVGI
jgi:hypothetical protein